MNSEDKDKTTTPVRARKPYDVWPPERAWRHNLRLLGVVIGGGFVVGILFILSQYVNLTFGEQNQITTAQSLGLDVQLQYPTWLRFEDSTAREAKRITVKLTAPDTQIVKLKLEPKGYTIQLQNKDGVEIEATKELTITQDTFGKVIWYVVQAHSGTGLWNMAHFDVYLSASAAAQYQLVPGASFDIRAEGALLNAFRTRLNEIIAGILGLLTLLQFAPRWWRQWQTMGKLKAGINQTGDLNVMRDKYAQYEQISHSWLFPRDDQLAKRYGLGEAKLCLEESKAALRDNKLKEAGTRLLWAERWGVVDKDGADYRAILNLQKLVKALESDTAELYEALVKLGGEDIDSLLLLLKIRNDKLWKKVEKPLTQILQTPAATTAQSQAAPVLLRDSLLTRLKDNIQMGMVYGDDGSNGIEQRKHIVHISRKSEDNEMKQVIKQLLFEDPSLDVRLEAAWTLARKDRPEKARLLRAVSPVVTEWLQAFKDLPSSPQYNPFETTSAEEEADPEYWEEHKHVYEHPAYEQLATAQSVALFARSGGGCTTGRLVARRVADVSVLLLEYTDFSALLDPNKVITQEEHVANILRRAEAALKMSSEALSLPKASPEKLLDNLMQQCCTRRGYQQVWVIVDNIAAYTEQTAPEKSIKRAFKHLVSNTNLLEIPQLYFKFLLPLEWRPIVSQYRAFRTDRVKMANLVWREEDLCALLAQRLKNSAGVEDLTRFVVREGNSPDPTMKRVVQAELIQQADGSPRRLIQLVNALFQHRARLWYESGKNAEQLYISFADWATVLEYLLKRQLSNDGQNLQATAR